MLLKLGLGRLLHDIDVLWRNNVVYMLHILFYISYSTSPTQTIRPTHILYTLFLPYIIVLYSTNYTLHTTVYTLLIPRPSPPCAP